MEKLNKLKTTKHIVAFIDLLGASELIEKDTDSLKKLYSAYKRAYNKKRYSEKK